MLVSKKVKKVQINMN